MTSDRLPRASLARGPAAAGIVLAAAAAALLGCVSTPPRAEPREYLDEQTAATVTVRGRPMVFALERPQLAVHARDYLTLVPIDVNRAGTHARYFYGYVWSTIDKRGLTGTEQSMVRFELVADGRRIPLATLAGQPRDVGLGEAPLPPPNAGALRMIVATTPEVQDFVAAAEEIVAVAVYDGGSDRFALWAR